MSTSTSTGQLPADRLLGALEVLKAVHSSIPDAVGDASSALSIGALGTGGGVLRDQAPGAPLAAAPDGCDDVEELRSQNTSLKHRLAVMQERIADLERALVSSASEAEASKVTTLPLTRPTRAANGEAPEQVAPSLHPLGAELRRQGLTAAGRAVAALRAVQGLSAYHPGGGLGGLGVSTGPEGALAHSAAAAWVGGTACPTCAGWLTSRATEHHPAAANIQDELQDTASSGDAMNRCAQSTPEDVSRVEDALASLATDVAAMVAGVASVRRELDVSQPAGSEW